MAEANPANVRMNDAKRVKILKNSRKGKKIAITRRLKELNTLMADESKSSRRRIKWLTEQLLAVFQELTEVCLQISILSEDIDEKTI